MIGHLCWDPFGPLATSCWNDQSGNNVKTEKMPLPVKNKANLMSDVCVKET